MVSIICAMGRNRAIGRGDRLLWRIPADLRRFKALTMGHPIVMGRKTHESIGRSLPGRRNLVVTRNPDFTAAGCEICSDLGAALSSAAEGPGGEEVFVIGGGEIYRQALARAERLYLTLVEDAPPDADTFFPRLGRLWRETSREQAQTGDLRYAFAVYEPGRLLRALRRVGRGRSERG
jgi:dihydrofolate reductase